MKRPKDGLFRDQTVLRYTSDGIKEITTDVHKFIGQGFQEFYAFVWCKTNTLVVVQSLANAGGGHLQGTKGDYVWWDDGLVETKVLHLEGGQS